MAAGTVDDSIDVLTRRVITGASVVMWDFSYTAVNTSIRGHTLPEVAILNFLIETIPAVAMLSHCRIGLHG